MLFFFVPETFWDRTPVPKSQAPSRRPSFIRRLSSRFGEHHHHPPLVEPTFDPVVEKEIPSSQSPAPERPTSPHVEFVENSIPTSHDLSAPESSHRHRPQVNFAVGESSSDSNRTSGEHEKPKQPLDSEIEKTAQSETAAALPPSHDLSIERDSRLKAPTPGDSRSKSPAISALSGSEVRESTRASTSATPDLEKLPIPNRGRTAVPYTSTLRDQPARTFVQQLKPYYGRLSDDSWLKVMIRPFILLSYPAILWSSAVYSCSIGWLIVISESMAMIYQDRNSYNFDALQTGLVYLSPFVGGLLGTAVAGKVSDIIVKAMARRNGGLYEPEFRLVMAIPILITTVIGLMGFGWSAQERDHWIVPTIFFGIISFGCSLGSTTSITFCVDSYRQYAGEALVTLNFCKNVLHGLVFSLFFTHWLSSDGSRMVYIWTGIIQLIIMLTTIPLFIYGKRLRMWTVRKNIVEKVLKS